MVDLLSTTTLEISMGQEQRTIFRNLSTISGQHMIIATVAYLVQVFHWAQVH